MTKTVRLVVEEGSEKGREFSIAPGAGVRIGRASGNDVALQDPSVSRFHCRVFIKEGQGLWIADLGSANRTMVNNQQVHEMPLRTGDRIAIGDSVLKVESDGSVSDQPVFAPKVVAPPRADGFYPNPETTRNASRRAATAWLPQRIRRPILAAAVTAAALLCVAVWAPKFMRGISRPTTAPADSTVAAMLGEVDIRYEKVEGSASNIFWYQLTVSDGQASVNVRDLDNNRSFSGPATKIDGKLLENLARDIMGSGFFNLEERYVGRSLNTYDMRDLAITIGRRFHRTTVLNAVEPETFERVRNMIEEFGLNEFGIRSLHRPQEELLRLARESWELGGKLYDEKNVRYENLFKAITAFKEVSVYVETIEPKPDFYPEAVAMQGRCEKELQAVYDNLRFEADKAIKLKEWRTAAGILEAICATIPDKANEWNKEAGTKLIDVQRRIER